MAGEADRVTQDVAAIDETRAHMADKLQRLDHRLDKTVGRTWALPGVVNNVIGTVQKVVLITRVGVGVFSFVRRRPWMLAMAAIGAVILIREISKQSKQSIDDVAP